MQFNDKICGFIASVKWIFAKTYADTWPHEYIVRERVDEDSFVEMVLHIRQYGYEGRFYSKKIVYFDHEGYTYWTMGAPMEETIIINRTQTENSYEQRLKNGTLPQPK